MLAPGTSTDSFNDILYKTLEGWVVQLGTLCFFPRPTRPQIQPSLRPDFTGHPRFHFGSLSKSPTNSFVISSQLCVRRRPDWMISQHSASVVAGQGNDWRPLTTTDDLHVSTLPTCSWGYTLRRAAERCSRRSRNQAR